MSKVLKESLAQPVLKAYRVLLDHKGRRVRLVPLALKVPKDLMAMTATTEYLRPSPPLPSRVAHK